MFNRTNLTLSARTLSNRLNLGTRSLALNASVNHGGQTLAPVNAYHGVMREGMVWYDVFPITQPRYGIPTIPGSFSQPQQSQPSCLTGQPGQPAEVVRVELRAEAGRPRRSTRTRARVGDPRFPSVAVTVAERRTASARAAPPSRSGWKSQGKPGLKRAAEASCQG